MLESSVSTFLFDLPFPMLLLPKPLLPEPLLPEPLLPKPFLTEKPFFFAPFNFEMLFSILSSSSSLSSEVTPTCLHTGL